MALRVGKLPEICEITASSSSTIYLWVAQGKFPKPIKLGARSSGWVIEEVEIWLKERIKASRPESTEV